MVTLLMKSNISSEEDYKRLLRTFLRSAYYLTLEKGSFSEKDFSDEIKRSEEEGKALLSVLKGLNLIKPVPKSATHYRISTGGKNNLKIVMTGGAFDILHLGHIITLKEARKKGDFLIVVVASDNTVEKNKGRPPINSQEKRVELLSHIDLVDLVRKGSSDPTKFLDIVTQYKPDIIVLGYDQDLSEEKLSNMLDEYGIHNTEVIKLKTQIPNEKSSLKLRSLKNDNIKRTPNIK